MNYVQTYDIFGIESKQIPCITGSGAPTTTTEGAVGCLYMDTDKGGLYKCVAVNNGEYAWDPAENGGSVEGAVLYTEQTLTDIQKEQALNNIGAASASELEQITETRVETSTNLFNPDEFVTGKWMGVNGKEGSNSNLGHTGFIAVTPGDIVTLGKWGSNGTFTTWTLPYVAAYNSDKTVVSSAGADGTYKKSYTVPDGISYIIVTIDLSGITTMTGAQINCTSDGKPLPYEQYSENKIILHPYGYETTQVAIKELQENVETLETKIGTDTTSINGHILSSTFDLPANTVVNLGEDIRLNRYNVHEFFCKFDAFDSVTIGHGNQKLYGAAVKVDATKIYILQNAAETVIYEYTHGLTISDFLSAVITVDAKGQAEVRICTAGGDYVTPTNLLGNNIWHGLAGNVFVKATHNCYDCKFVWNMSALLKDIYLFGDSYVPLHDNAQYTTYLAKQGYDNFMICGTPGANASGGLTQFQRIMAIKHPKLVIWALGMNNPDTASAVNSGWLTATQEVIDYCATNGIELALATIPNVPERINTHKNAWIKASGLRYVDFAKAVGAEETGSSWYTDMLKADQVHPATLGAKALAFRFLMDVPEILN